MNNSTFQNLDREKGQQGCDGPAAKLRNGPDGQLTARARSFPTIPSPLVLAADALDLLMTVVAIAVMFVGVAVIGAGLLVLAIATTITGVRDVVRAGAIRARPISGEQP